MIDTANITWINAVIMIASTFILYIIFLIAVHNMTLFNSYASIYNSVNSPLLWLNLIVVSGACFLLDYAAKSLKFLFVPDYAKELQIVYSRYGQINSTKRLSKRMIKKLNGNKKNEINMIEDNTRRERKKQTRSRENRTVHKGKKNSRRIEIQSISQSQELSKSNNE